MKIKCTEKCFLQGTLIPEGKTINWEGAKVPKHFESLKPTKKEKSKTAKDSKEVLS